MSVKCIKYKVLFSIHLHPSASQDTVTNTVHYQLAVLSTTHINRSILCQREGNDLYCHHSYVIKIRKSKKTIFWIHHKRWIHSSTPPKPQMCSATLIFWSLLTRLLLYRGHTEQDRGTSHCCFLLQSCSQRAWLYLAYTAQLFKGIIPGSYHCTQKGAAVS